MYENIAAYPQQVLNYPAEYYRNASQTRRIVIWGIAILAVGVFAYWIIVAKIGKNAKMGKSYTDKPNHKVDPNANTNGSNNGNVPVFVEDPYSFANDLVPLLKSSWLWTFCASPDDICYRLQKMSNQSDAFLAAVGSNAVKISGAKLSELISKNPCGCTYGAWFGRDTQYSLNKEALVKRLQNMGQ